MVKANAYGHGIKQICKNIQNEVDFFGVSCAGEGIILRNNNIVKPILVVGAYDKGSVRHAVINYLTLTVCAPEDILHLESVCKKLNIVCDVHIKVNTGMNRLGVSNRQTFLIMLERLKNNRYIKLKGVFSHFGVSDTDIKYTCRQNRIFKNFIKLCKDFDDLVFHISSGFAAINYRKFNHNMVRVGLAMYGYGNTALKPAITIISEIKAVNHVKKGSLVGYGATFKAKRPSKIAVIPLGYADGINLKLSNILQIKISANSVVQTKTGVCVNKIDFNKKSDNISVPVAGRICMDMFMCDVTDTDAKVGDNVIVFDEQNNATVWSKICGNHEYEILTGFKTNRMKIYVI